jgi:MFS transporter, DHA1 family, multidrug resistance protein
MSFADSQSTTPTRTSLEDDREERTARLETIQSGLRDDEKLGEDPEKRPESPRSSRTRADDVEAEAALEAGPDSNNQEEPKPAAKDPNLVEWNGPDDPENPQNLSTGRKWAITMLLSSLTVWITFSTSVFSQATEVTAALYGVSDEVMILATSLPLFVRFKPLC